jgi:hypothetical protein
MIFNQFTVFGLLERHGITKLSECFPKTTRSMLERGLEWLKGTLSDEDSERAFFDKSCPHFVVIDGQNHLVSCLFPAMYEDINDLDDKMAACVMMSANFHLQPATIGKDELADVVVTVVTRGDAKKFALPTCPTELTDVLGDLPDTFVDIEFYQRLGFSPDLADDDTLPVIVLLPKILLVTTEFPHIAGIPMSDTPAIMDVCIDKSTNTLLVEDFEFVWLKAMSLHMGGKWGAFAPLSWFDSGWADRIAR